MTGGKAAVVALALSLVPGAGPEAPRCFEVVEVGGESALLTGMRGDTLILTREPYSSGARDIVWWQAFLDSADPRISAGPEAIPWRPMGGDSIEIQLTHFNAPAALIVHDSRTGLSGHVRVSSDELGTPDARIPFLAESVRCQEAIERRVGASLPD